MANPMFSRRKILRGAGYAVTLPFLESLTPRFARANTKPPVRLLFYFQPDGTPEGNRPGHGELWFPEGTGTNFTWRELTAPLEPIRQDVIVFRGVDLSLPGRGSSAFTHPGGMRHALSCGERNSIDQVVGEQIGKTTRFKTLEIGVGSAAVGSGNSRMHYKNGASLPAEPNPNVVFQRLFGGGGGGGMTSPAELEALARLQARRKSVLDGVVEELNAIEGRLGKDDRPKVEAHVSSIRDVERSLVDVNAAMGVSAGKSAACEKPQVDLSVLKDQRVWAVTPGGSVPNIDKIAKVQQELAILALRCDLTRVATLFYQKSASYQMFPFLPLNDKGGKQHALAHHSWNNRSRVEDYKTIKKWQVKMYRELAEALKGIREADGSTMLDNSLILWISDMNVGSHGMANMPYVLAGRGGGAVKPGRSLVYNNVRHSRLFLAMAHAAGVRLEKYGPDTEPLDGLGG